MAETEYPYLDNTNADNRLLGLEVLLNPFIAHASPIRGEMFTRQSNQILLTNNNEFPYCFSGQESQIGEYQIDTSERDQDLSIIAIIPKYNINPGGNAYGNPLVTVIGIGEDKKLHHFDISNYTMVSHGFGFFNVHKNRHYLKPGLLPKDVKLSVSPAYKDGAYSLGINARCMLTNDEITTEDTFGISQEYADRCMLRSICTKEIFISSKQHPLNCYGDSSEFKIFPDIGQVVNADGVLCAFRTPTSDSFIPDLMSSALYQPNIHDKVYTAPPGSIILDVNVYINNNQKISLYLYDQLVKYQSIIKHYWQGIVDVYNEYKNKYELDHEFNTLVTRAMERLVSMGETSVIKGEKVNTKIKLISKNRTIDVAKIEIVYTTPIEVAAGYKLAINMGGKGVCKIIPTEDMPVDDYGKRADILINMQSINNRMIPGTLYETHYTNIAETIKDRLIANEVNGNQFEYVMGFLDMINSNFANLLRNRYNTPTKQKEYIEFVKNNFIYMNVPPFLNQVSVENCKKMYEKYGRPPTPVTFWVRDNKGNRSMKRTKTACFMGHVYTYILCKIPDPKAAGAAYINQHYVPMKLKKKSKKSIGSVSYTPIRFGEAEQRFLLAGLDDPDVLHRLFAIHATTPLEATGVIEEIHAAKNPFCIPEFSIPTKELKKMNVIANGVHSIFGVLGIDTRNMEVSDEDMQQAIDLGWLHPDTIEYFNNK